MYTVWWKIQRKGQAILPQESGILHDGGNNNQEADKLGGNFVTPTSFYRPWEARKRRKVLFVKCYTTPQLLDL